MIKAYELGAEIAISQLIRRVFDKFVGKDFTQEGQERFYFEVSPRQIVKRFSEKDLLLCHFENDILTGIIALRDSTHICLFFVDENFQRKGIGRSLFEHLIQEIDPSYKALTVYSSINAVGTYEKLGFSATDKKQVKDGILYVPMKSDLCINDLLISHMMRSLTNQVGNRAVGTAGNLKATEYIDLIFKLHGWSTYQQRFDAIDWFCEEAYIEYGGRMMDVSASPYSLGCDDSAPLEIVTSIRELERCYCRDKVLLLCGEIAREQLMPKGFIFYQPEEHQRIISLLETKGPKVIICATGRNASLAGGVYPFPLIEDGDFHIPSVLIKDIEGESLKEQNGVTVHVFSDARRIDSCGYNVIARKGPIDAEKIVITAHIDAKKGSPGALDNAAGVAVLSCLSKLLKDHRGGFAIELVVLNGEDHYNIPGQMRYLKDFDDDKSCILNINIDGVGFLEGATAYSFYDTPYNITASMREVSEAFPHVIEGQSWVQGDHSMFVQMGYPAIAFSSDWFIRHFDEQQITHTEKDTMDIIDVARINDTAMVIKSLIEDME